MENIYPYTNCQLSLTVQNELLIGIKDINQCIDIILRTIPGTDPLRPTFGCAIYDYIDLPLQIAAPKMKLKILEALEEWELRIKVTSVNVMIQNLKDLQFEISYNLIDGNIEETILWEINVDGVNRQLKKILSAQF